MTYSQPTERLDAGTFDIPVTEIRMGYRSAVYFDRARRIMAEQMPDQVVTVQVFQRGEDRTVGGVDEAVAVLRTCAGSWGTDMQGNRIEREIFRLYLAERRALRSARPERYLGGSRQVIGATGYEDSMRRLARYEQVLDRVWEPGWNHLDVRALRDGDTVQPWEPVLQVTGPYHLFAHLESVYLGILARQTKVATNVRAVTEAANGKPVLFFADRFDHYATQGGDGYAAHVGGAAAHATQAMGAWWGGEASGTMPHALIAAHGGLTEEACASFHDEFPETDLVALVDFDNDCVRTSLDVLARFGKDLRAVRLDTSGSMMDESLAATFELGGETIVRDDPDSRNAWARGVNPYLVQKVRDALDAHGGKHVRIVVSGGFDAGRIARFEELGVPVDSYAVGSSLLRGSCDFTADVVAPVAKVGRTAKSDVRLEVVA